MENNSKGEVATEQSTCVTPEAIIARGGLVESMSRLSTTSGEEDPSPSTPTSTTDESLQARTVFPWKDPYLLTRGG